MMKFVKTGRIGRALGLIVGGAIATAVVAQTVPDDGAGENSLPDTGLNIPANLQLFGKADPNVRKATAIVNDTVITGTDVDQRLALVLASNGDAKLSEDAMQQLRLRILGALVDETLEIQEAKAHDVTVTADEIDKGVVRVARNFQKSMPELRTYLRKVGASEHTLRRQVEAELAWSRYLRRRVEPFVNVGDDEVQAILDRMKRDKGTNEYHVKEIYLKADQPDQAQQVYAETRSLIEEIQQGKARFEDVAQSRSDASTRSVAGDLGWVKPTQLPDSLAQAASTMDIGQMAGPIETPGGFSILYLVDRRQVLTADPRDAILSLRQISIPFPAGISQADASAKVASFAKALETIKGCGDVNRVATAIGAEVVDNDQVVIRQLPVPLQDILVKLQVGESTQPFGSPTDGVRSLVMCSRDQPQDGQLPGMEQIRGQMEQQAVNLRAEHKLRDLRRDAIIEYR